MSRNRLLATVAAGLLICAGPALAGRPESGTDSGPTRVISVAARAGSTQRITLALGKAAVVQLDVDSRDVLVSEPGIVNAIVRTPRRIFLMAQKIGQTNAFIFDAAGHQLLSVDIRVERDVTDLASVIATDIPGSRVKVSSLNDNIVLTGTVDNATDATRAQDLAAQFVRKPDGQVDQTKVINMLKVGAHEQVLLKVRVAEMQRQIAKQFGINLTAGATAAGVPLSFATANPYGLMGQALSSASGAQLGLACGAAANALTTVANSVTQTINSNPAITPPSNTQTISSVANTHCGAPNNAQGLLNALEQTGLMHTLAEPNLTAVSGETAKFLAGGEFPIPGGRDLLGNIQIIFKQFGVGLSFTPVVLNDRHISLQLSTEVSELTNTGAFTLRGGTSTNANGQTVSTNDLTIPALAVRRAETTVELPSGGSFAVAGLLQHTTKQVLDEFPGLKEMPVLGALFRSRDFENDETELVVIVSAYLVDPATEKKFASPTDGFVAPSDLSTIAMGRLNRTVKADSQGVKSAGDGKVGFIVE